MMKYVLASFLALLSLAAQARPDWNVVITSPNVSVQISQPGNHYYQPQYQPQYRPHQPYQYRYPNYNTGYYQQPSYHNPYNQGRPVIYPHHHYHHHHHRR